MSTGNLKSIDKLRDTAFSYAPNIRRQVNMACDEIEDEIAERYIELPVDADGVPWHIGDEVRRTERKDKPNIVTGIYLYADGMHKLHVSETECTAWTPNASKCRHVKPRTIEDVLYECFHDCMYKYPTGIEDIIGKYADELRSMWMVEEPDTIRNELMDGEVVGE